MEVRVGPAVIVTHVNDEVLISETNGTVYGHAQQGYFVADTRLVSGYELKIARHAPVLLNSSAIEAHSARFEFTNPRLLDDEGFELPEHTLHLRLDRVVDNGVHEDYTLTNYAPGTIDLIVELSIESDFADLFDVKTQRLQRRGILRSTWDPAAKVLENHFAHESFQRGLRVEMRAGASEATYANGGLLFPVKLDHGATWHACVIWRPVLDATEALPTVERCHDLIRTPTRPSSRAAAKVTTSDPAITATIRQAIDDLSELRMRTQVASGFLGFDENGPRLWDGARADDWLPAAGVPWFVSIFGRDALTTSLQALPISYRYAEGSLRALAALQATSTDDDRDMQPGKIEHELRRGELAHLHMIPHTPYYGTHDATPLFVLTAAANWKWHGSRAELDGLRPHVDAALQWIDRDGDEDGDGIQEYRTRSTRGYFNQGWKDAHDAILHADGSSPELPIATCELQGLVVAAKRDWAEVLEEVYGETTAAQRLRSEAERLAGTLEDRFFWEAEGTYYLGLDGRKRPIETVASNAGHLLYYGAIDAGRANRVAQRLFEEDLWSGWGIRTVSTRHPSYNPFSYQLGSVWPHDNVLIAAGLRRYGLDAEAQTIAQAMFDAAGCLVNRRLPELFAGLDRDGGSFPVQYLGANVPQAWASGAIVQLVDVMMGFEPNASGRSLRLHPALPPWLDDIAISGLLLAEELVDFAVRRTSSTRYELRVGASGGLDIGLAAEG
jgi:glycogen debranching enzyme